MKDILPKSKPIFEGHPFQSHQNVRVYQFQLGEQSDIIEKVEQYRGYLNGKPYYHFQKLKKGVKIDFEINLLTFNHFIDVNLAQNILDLFE